jgi:hypothetical protein
MRKIFVAMALSTAGLYAAGACDGGTTNVVNVYTDVTLTPGTVLSADSADSCVVGGSVFSNFQVVGGAGTDFVSPGDGFSLSVDVTSANTAEFLFTNLGTGDIELYYTAVGGFLQMTLNANSTTAITEVICGTPYAVPSSNCASPLNQTSPFGVTSTDTVASTMVTAAAEDYIVKDITGGSEFTQSIAPEPMTLSLVGAGLLGLGILGRKLRK